MSLVVWWVAPPSEWVERTTRHPCAKSCGDSSGLSTVVLAAAHDRLLELAYFVTTAGPMCIAFVYWLFYFLLAPLPLKKTAKASSSESLDAIFLVWDSCVSCVHKLDQVSRASFSYEFLGRRTWVVCHGLNRGHGCNHNKHNGSVPPWLFQLTPFWLFSFQHSETQMPSKYCCPDCFEHTTTVPFPALAPALAPVYFHIKYKIATLTWNVVTLNQPLYLTHLLTPYTPGYSLWSRDKHLLLEPAVSTIIGSQGFSYAAPSVWNKLPQ